MQLIKIENFTEFTNLKNACFPERFKKEFLIKKEFEQNLFDNLEGYCQVCEKPTKFKIHKGKNGKINFRDTLVCEFCRLGNRKRFMLSYLKDSAKSHESKLSVFTYEQVTRFFKIGKTLKNIELIGSEFLGYNKKSGEVVDGIRHEDALNLSFPNNSFDVVISNDVFEHVPNIQKTLSESFRILKKSGILLVSIPFHADKIETQKRAILDNGVLENLLPPIYHNNPVDAEKGSLVFYDYGWDFLEYLKNSGFIEAYMLGSYDHFYGYFGGGLQFIFVASK